MLTSPSEPEPDFPAMFKDTLERFGHLRLGDSPDPNEMSLREYLALHPEDHPEGCLCVECCGTPKDELTPEELEYFGKAIPQFPEKEDDDEE